jgi:DNA polymerase-3 subunit gamma/tau
MDVGRFLGRPTSFPIMAKHKPAASKAAASPREGYTVLARRYRPQQFSDLVGQEPVSRALVNALQSNRVAHAYLFTGSRGVGKTSTARILAKALNCLHGPTPTPCGTCDICQAVASGEDVDVIEIDGASNRGIDEVREIRQNVQFRPSRSRFKIYIIDEVHMLTAPAFNALLKTLEEPPAHVKFIFATTEVQRIPVTILSRCQRFDFAGIGTPRIVQRLKEIVVGEGMEADDEALELVARRAGGSMRDAQSLLDQLLAFGGQRLTAEQVHRLLGTAQEDRVIGLAAAVLDHDARRTLELVGQAADEGLQLGELLDQLIDYWRDLMVAHCAGLEGATLSVGSAHREALARQATAMSLDTILAGLDILAAAKARMRGSSHGRILLEMALVRLGRLDDLIALSQLAQWLNQTGGAASARAAAPAPVSGEPRGRPVEPPETGKKKPDAGVEPAPVHAPLALSNETLSRVWQEILTQVGPFLANDLNKANSLAISGPNTLVLGFPSRYNLQREHCQEPANVLRIEEALNKISGRAWAIRVEAARSGGPAEGMVPDNGESVSPSNARRQRLEAAQKPLVKKIMERMGAQILDMEEGFATSEAPAESGTTDDSEEA